MSQSANGGLCAKGGKGGGEKLKKGGLGGMRNLRGVRRRGVFWRERMEGFWLQKGEKKKGEKNWVLRRVKKKKGLQESPKKMGGY